MTEPAPHGPVPSPRQLAWHRRERYGFVHFTITTFTGHGTGCGLGDESPALFDPTQLDCRQWVDAARRGGLTGLILTAKHHDGFCLWPTRTTDHHLGHSPFRGGGGDVVGELATACAEAGLDLGIYLSPWDRNHPEYARPGYVAAYHEQLRELLTGYGPLFELWFDGANHEEGYYGGARERRTIDRGTYYRYDELWDLCRRHQNDAVIFSDAPADLRWCGNESGFANATSWAKVRPEGFEAGVDWDAARLLTGDADGTVWRPVECDVHTRPSWFHRPRERSSTADELFEIWLASVGRGAGLNLNLAPDRRGLIPADDVAALAGMQSRIAAFTAVDLARGRPVRATATALGEPAALVDGDRDTFWQATPGAPASIEIAFGRDERIAGVRLEEAIRYGQRVAAFAIDIRNWGNWYEVATGSTIGAQRIIPLTAATGDALRIRILDTQAPPVLARIMAYGA